MDAVVVTHATPASRADPSKPAWGVRRHVTFLETWCFLLVVLVAAVAALWLHERSTDPGRTNVIFSFMGWGALACSGALVVRILRTAIALRDRCEALAMTVAKPPELPTAQLIGKSWWQAPAVFVGASSIAWWLLEKADALCLYN